MQILGLAIVAAEPLVSQRAWLERLALLVPSAAATRWLLLADLVCLVAFGLSTRQPWLGVPLAVGVGFFALNALGVALTEFYLALAVFHLAVGVMALAALRRARWLGAATLGLAIVLGVLT